MRHEQNFTDMKLRKDNTSGVTGVSWDKTGKKWIARFKIKNRNKHVGMFTDLEEAKQAYLKAKEKYA